eukprot:CAMPEP_0183313682 /NCGR_PEP_ID=MMETSP0160_2-20130417/46164_1 /TAXON_ID=2839 ORGANISM="Odontella Sinensis, Strain Grunow 1884" /NCGR_SAMPLE_ID=MMETSP0160_2 /ASSEMBLY_ACC=CAM_ASM_000250 /LENGTH=50 /DNA_ID=CAMNT_0025478823 /DNA_START=153 /DNA_END=302 /DNA_ORIENTATION=+
MIDGICEDLELMFAENEIRRVVLDEGGTGIVFPFQREKEPCKPHGGKGDW